MNTAFFVMVGLVPTITSLLIERSVQDVDARHKGEHDELESHRLDDSGPSLRKVPERWRGFGAVMSSAMHAEALAGFHRED